ncbi:hypothetical protein [Rubripirellula reticaptiva]|uniref:Uncharacterized protein n=1 Tax=Rubripirellula reticaptiva TaxID=2528013 RepID=A0A5C6EHI6_9BACT|nr:hypothetical protein [Rubripirellula reticaptiva]TWU47141.1 hypothetical protein Poly59_61160 [Rubripirellula reticaptiva]
MRYVLTFGMLLSMSLLARAEDGSSAEVDTDTTGRFYEIVGDFMVNQDKLEDGRFAFVANGTRVVTDGKQFQTHSVIWIGAKESSAKQLDANSITMPTGDGVVLERWRQRIVDNGKYSIRGMPYTDRPTKEFDSEEEYHEIRQDLVPLRPLDQSLSMATSLKAGGTPKRIIESFLRENAVLLYAKYNKELDVVARMRFDHQMPRTVDLIFERTSGYMPTEVRHTIDVRKDISVVASFTRTSWKKVGPIYVPTTMEATLFSLNQRDTTQFDLELEWRIGESLNGISLVDLELKDWREPVRVLFDQDWQRASVRPARLADFGEEE